METSKQTTKYFLRILYLSVFLDLIAVGMVIPVVVAVYKTIQMDAITYGFIGSCYGFAQFISNPILGQLSDQYGRKNILLLSFVGSSFSYLLLGLASNVFVLFLSRIIVGLVKQTVTIAHAMITDHTTEANRVKELGNVMVAVYLGFVVGPAIGSYLQTQVGAFIPTLLSALIYLVDFVLVYFFLPNFQPKISEATDSKPVSNFGTQIKEQFNKILTVLSSPLAGGLLLNKFAFAMAGAIVMSNFGVIIMEVFGLEPEYVGYILSYNGLVGVFTSYLTGIINQRFKQNLLIVTSSLALITMDILTITLITSLTGWLLLTPLEAIFTSLLTTLNLAMYTSAFPKEKIGFAMGVAGSIDSIARIIGPLLGGVIFQYMHVIGIKISCASLTLVCLLIWQKMILPYKNPIDDLEKQKEI